MCEQSERGRVNMTDRSSYQQKYLGEMHYAGLLIAACIARFAQLRRARPRSATVSLYSRLKPCFSDIPGKNDPHILIPAAFPGPGWAELSGDTCLDPRALGWLWAMGFPAIFWQTSLYLRAFSTRSESVDFTGFPGTDRRTKKANGARIGLFSTQCQISSGKVSPARDT